MALSDHCEGMKASHTLPVRLLPLSAVVILAACIPAAPQPTPAPSPAPATRPAPPPPAPPAPSPTADHSNWNDAPQTPGNWYYRQGPNGGLAIFGPQAGESRFSLECDRNAQQVTIRRLGQVSGATTIVIRTETASRSLAAQPVAKPQPLLVADLPARDQLLDAMALTRGRFAVETAGLPPLYLPAWGEVTRVVEDCR